jgi:Acyl-CoA dehydrogenase, N-terminal domain
MQFAFTEDQLTITGAARDMLVETCTPADLRKMLEAGKPRDEARWTTISEMGLIGILAPEDVGGLGMSMVDLIGIAEAAGYVGLPEPLVEMAGITIPMLARLEDNRGWLDKALAGAVIALGHPSNPFVADADSADALMLADGDDIHLIAPDAFTLTRAESFDPFRRLFSVEWTPSPATKVGNDWADAADRGALLAAAQMIGLAHWQHASCQAHDLLRTGKGRVRTARGPRRRRRTSPRHIGLPRPCRPRQNRCWSCRRWCLTHGSASAWRDGHDVGGRPPLLPQTGFCAELCLGEPGSARRNGNQADSDFADRS